MADRFSAVPDELRAVAGTIGDVIAPAIDMTWPQPGGDYGHPGVQRGWQAALDSVRAHVRQLHGQARGHADDLVGAASGYHGVEDSVSAELARAASHLSGDTSPAGGGTLGPGAHLASIAGAPPGPGDPGAGGGPGGAASPAWPTSDPDAPGTGA